MPQQGQYKKHPKLIPDPNESFQFCFEISSPYREDFTRWMTYEIVGTMQWNTHLISETKRFKQWHFPGLWRISITADHRLLIETNKKNFDIRSGLRISATRRQIIVG